MATKYRYQTVMLLILPSLLMSANGQSISDIQTIMDTVLNGYNRDIRPAEDQSKAVVVNITFELVGIQEFNEVSETFTSVGVLNMAWIEPRITWDPALYNNTYMVNIRKTNVWVPYLVLTNPKESVKVLADRHDWMTVRYLYNGVAYWSPGEVFHSTCAVDVTYYPFDVQNCEIQFISWGTTASEIYLHSAYSDVLLTFFSQNGEWILKSARTQALTSGSGPNALSIYVVHITIERRAAFFLVNVVLPIIFMSILNVLVFWVPAESGERVSYAITVLLAVAVFLTIVGENMPKTSEPMSILCYFLIINLVLSALICAGAIFNLNIYFKHCEKPVSRCLDSFTRFLLRKKRFKSTPVEDIVEHLDADIVTLNGDNTMDKQKAKEWIDAVGEITGTALRDHKPVTWREVSYAVDKVLGAISVLWLVVTSTSLVAMVATHHSPAWE